MRPHFIVPDTNCFVDHLQHLRMLAGGQMFQLMVPIVGEWREAPSRGAGFKH